MAQDNHEGEFKTGAELLAAFNCSHSDAYRMGEEALK